MKKERNNSYVNSMNSLLDWGDKYAGQFFPNLTYFQKLLNGQRWSDRDHYLYM